MNWDIFWLVAWIMALFLTPVMAWLAAVLIMVFGVEVAPGKWKAVGWPVLAGIILVLGWLLLVGYNIINQIITLAGG
jgi:hypothetical protein